MDDVISAVRTFNRFFTKHVGALNPDFLGTDMTLAEARLLFEIAHAHGVVAADLQAVLGMDAGYVSRVLKRFEGRGWIARGHAEHDSRRRPIALTAEGQAAFGTLDARQRRQVEQTLARLGAGQQRDLAAALTSARLLMGERPPTAFTVRTFRAGDMGLIAARQSILYRSVYGWGAGIEANIGEVTAAFIRNFKPGREQCWVADADGAMAGSIFLTDEGNGLSRLRLLYVEPTARGLGIGDALVSTCLNFAREIGFQAVTLWTHTILDSARRIYAAHGFEIVEVEMHEEFGEPIQGETWRLNLIG
jgi:DNA-binding MarR family transcriptional regulator/GNAT superfamily N-acetyltransferase